MRIGINAISYDKDGGGHTFIDNLVRNLAEVDKKNIYFLFCENTSTNRIKQNNFNYLSLPSPNKYLNRIIHEQWLMPKYVKQLNLELFYSPYDTAPIFMDNVQTIITFQNNHFYVAPYNTSITGFRKYYFKALIPASLKKASKIVAVSQSAKNDLIKYNPGLCTKIEVVYEGVDEIFHPKESADDAEWERIRQTFGIKQEIILFVSTLRSFKNADKLIDAYFILKKEYSITHQLVLIGNPVEKNYVNKLINKISSYGISKEVIFINNVKKDTLRLFYNYAKLLVYPSAMETFGLPPLEAMACGCPVITSNRGAMPEIAGDAALVVDPNDINELTNAINMTVSDEKLRHSLIDKGYKRATQFKWRNMALRLLQTFKGAGSVKP